MNEIIFLFEECNEYSSGGWNEKYIFIVVYMSKIIHE